MARGLAYNPLLKSYPDSQKVNAVSEGAETLYTRLIAQSDDFGRYYGEPRFVLAKLFTARMLAGQLAEQSVAARLDELARVGLIRIYEVEGVRYLEMVGLHKRLRTDMMRDSRFPAPTEEGVAPRSAARRRTRSADHPAAASQPPPAHPVKAAPPDTGPPVLTYPCDGLQPEWHLTPPLLTDLKDLFPMLDVLGECRMALAWIKANPQMRKTARGMPRYLTNWLTRSQNRSSDRGNDTRTRHSIGTRAGYDPHAQGDI